MNPATPSIVGVVEAIEVHGGSNLVMLSNGQTFDLGTAEWVLGGNGAPTEGQLLLAGERDGERWYYSLAPDDQTCPFLAGSLGNIWEDQDSFVFQIGFQLPKAEDFEPLSVPRHPNDPILVMLCVNERGEVIGEPR